MRLFKVLCVFCLVCAVADVRRQTRGQRRSASRGVLRRPRRKSEGVTTRARSNCCPPPAPREGGAAQTWRAVNEQQVKTQSFEGETDLNISSQAFSPTRACKRQAERARLWSHPRVQAIKCNFFQFIYLFFTPKIHWRCVAEVLR